jgi:4-aminobutyrate aminotransferase-like enzyme
LIYKNIPRSAWCIRELKRLLKSQTAADETACIVVEPLLTCGTFNNIVGWIPPLVVTAGQIEEALGLFRTALKAH